jgi:hypothetical protein
MRGPYGFCLKEWSSGRSLQLEAMQSKTRRNNELTAISDPPSQTEQEPETDIEKLVKEIAALKAEIKCFNCNQPGAPYLCLF